jgi:hypothetical protein
VTALVDVIRFFRVVPPIPPLMVTTFAAITVVSIGAVLVDASYAAGTVTAVMVLQLFAASSGFAGHARRGYFDLLLTRGDPRVAIGAGHWLLSAAPGLASWAAIGAVEAVVSGGRPGVVAASGSVAAMVAVSTTPWALTVALPRFAAAIGWITVVVMSAALHPSLAAPDTLANFIYPLRMIGHDVAAAPAAAMPTVAFGMVSLALALVWIHRTGVPLEAAQ